MTQPSQGRGSSVPKAPSRYAVCPKVGRASQRLFSAVVEVVAKRRTALRLELKPRDQVAAMNHQHVPLLRWPEETRKFELGTHVDVRFGHAIGREQPANQLAKPIHLLTACHRRPLAAIRAARKLLLRLVAQGLPIVSNRRTHMFLVISGDEGRHLRRLTHWLENGDTPLAIATHRQKAQQANAIAPLVASLLQPDSLGNEPGCST
jgi:hypothetical protein